MQIEGNRVIETSSYLNSIVSNISFEKILEITPSAGFLSKIISRIETITSKESIVTSFLNPFEGNVTASYSAYGLNYVTLSSYMGKMEGYVYIDGIGIQTVNSYTQLFKGSVCFEAGKTLETYLQPIISRVTLESLVRVNSYIRLLQSDIIISSSGSRSVSSHLGIIWGEISVSSQGTPPLMSCLIDEAVIDTGYVFGSGSYPLTTSCTISSWMNMINGDVSASLVYLGSQSNQIDYAQIDDGVID